MWRERQTEREKERESKGGKGRRGCKEKYRCIARSIIEIE